MRKQYPDAEIHIFYIDIRTMGTLEDFYTKVKDDPKLFLHKGKVAKIERLAGNKLAVTAEDVQQGKRIKMIVDLAVLATGMQPNNELNVPRDGYGFVEQTEGIYGAGCAKRPVEVVSAAQDATASALRAIQSLRR